MNNAEAPDQAKAAEIDRKRVSCTRTHRLALSTSVDWISPEQTKLKQELFKLDAFDREYQYKKVQIRDGAGRTQERITSAHSK